jgi:ribonuclease PH
MKRANDELRPVSIERDFPTHAAGSVVIATGETRVLCTAMLSTDVPPFLIDRETGQAASGWVTAEYNMLPGCTPERQRRGPNSRATEIKRLIGRSLRAAVDMSRMPGVAITCDCDVLKADGGTRTASITGAFVALADALAKAEAGGLISGSPIVSPVAAVSVGVVGGAPMLDLDYDRDSRAEVDMNVVINGEGQYIEVQGTGEQGTFSRSQLDELLTLAEQGIGRLIEVQREARGER